MNGAWIFQIGLVLVPSIVTAILGYLLGVRQQKKQALREHITEVVRNEYPALFSEIKRNLGLLDNHLENPNATFNFAKLDQLYNSGYDHFMEKHHKDLFLMVDSFQEDIVPKFHELTKLLWDLREKMHSSWLRHLEKTLPNEVVKTSRNIVDDLLRTINPYYVLPDLLNERYDVIRNKIEGCILNRTAHIHREKAKRPFVIKGQSEIIDYDEVSQLLIEQAKPEIASFIEAYKKLKELNKREVKEKLLPLLQEYISNPV